MTSKSALWAKVKPGRRGAESPHRPSRRSLPCVHEGDVIEPCRSCGGGDSRHVRECDRHGRATRVEAGKGVAVCGTCADYEPDPALLPRIP